MNESHLIFGIFDKNVTCEAIPRTECVYIPNTTWTTGRNTLLEVGHKYSIDNDLSFDHWTFSDSDVYLLCCHEFPCANRQFDPVNNSNCFSEYEFFLDVTHAPMAALGWSGNALSWLSNDVLNANSSYMYQGVQAFDAAFNTFHVDVLPVLLPYITEMDNTSWWASQVG
jgi:hypothetical protein